MRGRHRATGALCSEGLNDLNFLNALNESISGPLEMLGKKPEGARPRSRCRVFAVSRRAEIGEGVGRVGIGMKFMGLAQPRHLGVELAHIRW